MNNPYETDTPEWQLFENARSSELLATSYAKDAEAAEKALATASERREQFEAALKAIGISVNITAKNPHKDGTPAWVLHKMGWEALEKAAKHTSEITGYRNKATMALEKSVLYKAALEKLAR